MPIRNNVAVTVTPVTVPTIFPVTGNSFSTGASAIAGFAGITVCNAAPIFICNPYETAGMTDTQATATLHSNLAPQQQLKLSQAGNNAGPGHFGWVTTPDGCHSTPCERQWVASTSGACYNSNQIDVATGSRVQMEKYFDVRFDIYATPPLGPSAAYAPSVNVRKGYQATGGNWCSASTASPYFTTQAPQTVSLVPNATITTATGNTDTTGPKNFKNNPTLCEVTNVQANVVGTAVTPSRPLRAKGACPNRIDR
jgi:hypothetical protein